MNAGVLFSTVSYNQGGLLALSGATFYYGKPKEQFCCLSDLFLPPAVLLQF
jgi:hypothetical protein